jgi:hypothetical protein
MTAKTAEHVMLSAAQHLAANAARFLARSE